MIVYCVGYDGPGGPVERWGPNRTWSKKKLPEVCRGLAPGTRIWIDKLHLLDTLDPKELVLRCMNQQGHVAQAERVFESTVKEHRPQEVTA